MSNNGTRIKPSRPNVSVGGSEQLSLAEGLLDLRIHESLDGLFSCEATFGNWGSKDNQVTFLYFDRRALDFGKELKISLGTDELFKGRISALEGRFPEGESPALTVLAEDRHQDLRMVRRTRTFADVTDSDVINQLAADHGLVPDVGIQGPTHKVLAQLNQSDLAFLRERARALEAELWMDGTNLKVKPRADRSGPSVKMGYGHELREFTVVADLANQRTNLKVAGWDVAAKEAISEEVGADVVNAELKGGKSGPSLLATALGDRKESVVHSVPISSREAHSRAETLYKRMARRFLTGRGVGETTAALRVGCKVNLEHLGELFSGEYYVTEVTHRFDGAGGLRTEFLVERPGLGGAA